MKKRVISFTITICILFSLNAVPAEAASSQTEVVINAITSYAAQKTFKSSYCGQAWGCFAFCNYVWKNVFGYDYYSKKYTGVATQGTSSNVYQFLSQNQAKAGDILWCHSPEKNPKITHNMIVLGYDASGIWISDATSRGKLWHNNEKVNYDSSDYKQNFDGSCILTLYKINDNLWNSVSSTKPVAVGKTSQPSVSVDGQTVTVSWNYTGSASKIDVYLLQDPWSWEDIKCQISTTSNSCTFTNVAPGDYCAFTIARPNADSAQSEWTSFSVLPGTSPESKSDTPVSAVGPYYSIWNMGSEKMLNVVSNSSKSGTNVTVYQEDGTTGQNFAFTSNGRGGYILEPQCAPTCALNVYGQSSTPGANVTIWTKSGNSTQDWIIEPTTTINGYLIRSADNPDYVLTAAGTGNASNVQLQPYERYNMFQLWVSRAFASISEPNENTTPPDVQIPGVDTEKNVLPLTDTYYTIRNVGSEKMLNVVSNSSKSGANITVYQADGTTGQNFMFIPDGTGGYVLQPQCAPSCALNIYGQSAAEGYNITTWTKSGHSTQSWKIERDSTWGGCIIRSMNNPDYVVTATGSGNASNVQLQRYDSSNPFQVWTSAAF